MGTLTNLEELYFQNNSLTGSIPTELGNLTNLRRLNFSDNGLTGSIPAELGSLVNLESLSLGDNDLTGSIPTELGTLTNLEELYFQNNSLTGSIPTELGNLTNLRRLNFSDNGLTGSIPKELGGLVNLEALYLTGNDLTSAIPSQLGGLASLRYLRLNCNKLTGLVPLELANASNLSVLYIGGNRLSQPLPTLTGIDVRTTDVTCGSAFNSAPAFSETSPATRSVDESAPSGSAFGEPVAATDSHEDPITYSLAGTDESSFSIDVASGQLSTNTGLDHDTKSSYSVTVGTDDDYGGSSSVTVNIAVTAVPGAPIIDNLTPGDSQLTVAWTAPSKDGGLSITAYDLQHKLTADASWTLSEDVWQTGGGNLEHTVPNLVNGSEYQVQVRAVNSAGDGSWSVTQTGTPAHSLDLTVSFGTSGYWGDEGGSAILVTINVSPEADRDFSLPITIVSGTYEPAEANDYSVTGLRQRPIALRQRRLFRHVQRDPQ